MCNWQAPVAKAHWRARVKGLEGWQDLLGKALLVVSGSGVRHVSVTEDGDDARPVDAADVLDQPLRDLLGSTVRLQIR